jgi:cyclin B
VIFFIISTKNEFHPGKYIDRQVDINSKMRAILVDWLVEVHMKFRLVPETLYLCTNIIDRYCAVKPVSRARLQLVGVTALLVACKYEEIYPPEVRDCVYITDRAYTREQVLDMEQDILKTLHWKLTVPTAYPFLLRFIQIVNATELQAHAANYYMERTLQEHELLMYPPSLVCAAAVVLSLNNADIYRAEKIRKPFLPGIPTILLEYTEFDVGMLLKCAEDIARYVAEEPITASRRQLIAVKKKFENKKYCHVSTDIKNPVYQELVDACIKNPH